VVDTLRIEAAGSSNDSVNFVSLLNEQLRQVGSILPRNPCDERALGHVFSPQVRRDYNNRSRLSARHGLLD
jgi:hypothetical protein